MGDPRHSSQISAVAILIAHFNKEVKFVTPRDGYRQKTADYTIGGVEWEIKSLTGTSLSTLKQRMKEASKQSRNIIVDLRQSGADQTKAIAVITSYANSRTRTKKILCITKSSQLIVIK